MATPSILSGMDDIVDRYDGFIFDVWGVLHDGLSVFDGTVEVLEALAAKDKHVVLLTNSPNRMHQIAQKLENMGIKRSLYKTIVSSGEAAYRALTERHDPFHASCGTKCFHMGDDVFMQALYDAADDNAIEIVNSSQEADFVCVSNPRGMHLDADYLQKELEDMLNRDTPLICLNPDEVVRIGDELYPCGGGITDQYAEMGGRTYYHGKPHNPVYETAHHLLGVQDKSKILAVGDSIRTDVTGACDYGIDVAFNLPGIHWHDLTEPMKGDVLCQERLSSLIEGTDVKPTYLINGFAL